MPKSEIFKKVFYCLLVPFILLIIVQLVFDICLNNKIKTNLQKAIYRQSDGEYNLTIQKLEINIFNQSLFLTGIRLIPVDTIHKTKSKFRITTDKIKLIDFKLFSFLFKKELIVNRVELVNPSGSIYRSSLSYYETKKDTLNNFSPYKSINGSVHSLIIKDIKIRNADFKVYDSFNEPLPSVSSTDNEIRITNFRITQKGEEEGHLFLADKFDFELNKINYKTKDSLYTLSIKKITGSYVNSSMQVDSVQLTPNFSKKEFSIRAGKQVDRIKISVVKTVFKQINTRLFFEGNWIISKGLNIEKLAVSAYRDKNMERKPQRSKSVQQLIKSISYYLAIDSLIINNSVVRYEEVPEGNRDPGMLYFNNVSAIITNCTNDTGLFRSDKDLKVKASGLFMDKARLKVSLSFPLLTDSMVFNCSGKLNKIPLASLNPMLIPVMGVEATEGNIDSMVFQFHANEVGSNGNIAFVYHDFQIKFVDQKTRESNILKKSASFLVNQFLIRKDNPSGNVPIRIAEINYPRDPSRFIFNYSWKSLLSGIKPALGIPFTKSKILKDHQNG